MEAFFWVVLQKKKEEERRGDDPLKNVRMPKTLVVVVIEQKKRKEFCIHSLVIRARFGGIIQMDTTAAADDDDDDEREKEGSAKETLEKSTLRVVQRELESVPSSTKAANGKVKPTLTTTKIIAFLSQVVSSFCIRAPPRETGTRETHFAARAFFCFAFVFLLSQVYKRRGNVFYLSTKEELLRETKEKLAEMSE